MNTPPRRRIKWLWRTLWFFGFVALLIVGLWHWSYYTALAERDRLVKELEAKGEKVWWRDFAKQQLEGVSPETGAELYLAAVAAIGGEYNMAGPRVPTIATQEMLAGKKWKPGIYPEVEKELKLGAKAMEYLAQVEGRRPGLLTTNITTDSPITILLPHIQNARSLSRYLQLERVDALGKGDVRRAYRAVELSYVAAEQLAVEPLLISQLVRIAMTFVANEILYGTITYAGPTEEEFKRLDAMHAERYRSFTLRPAMQGERAMMLTSIETDVGFKDYLISSMNRPRGTSPDIMARDLWFALLASPLGRPVKLRHQIWLLKAHENGVSLIDEPKPWPEGREDMFNKLRKDSPLEKVGVGDNPILSHNPIYSAGERYRRRLLLARWALRLRRYYDQHGKLPDKLEAICDNAMPTIDVTWFQNTPIVYKLIDKGFILEAHDSIVPKDQIDRKADFGLKVEIVFEAMPNGKETAK